MIAEVELQEYLDEIRQEVCTRCVERPPGGPPCGIQGKPCGVELHLPRLIESVRQVHSDCMDPYLETNRREVCQTCPFLHHSYFCPCPMDTLAVLVVQAIEKVEQRHEQIDRRRKQVEELLGHERPNLEEITRAYLEAAGTWSGCDWPTVFGPAELNLRGWTAAEAEAHALEVGREERKDWEAAALWLREVERRAQEAESEAEKAVAAAGAGDWRKAAEHARRAWMLEFATGRPFRHQPAGWQQLYELLDLAAWIHLEAEAAAASHFSITTA